MVERYMGREKVHMEVIVINGRAEGRAFFLCRKSWIIVPFLHRKSRIVKLSRKMCTLIFNQYHPRL